MEISEEEEDVRNCILKTVNEAWKDSKPALLSALGAGLQGRVSSFAKSKSVTLRRYIEQELESDLRIIQHSQHTAMIAVVPKAAEIGDADRVLDGIRHGNRGKTYRFSPAFWAAFRKTLPEGMMRILKTDGSNNFETVSLGTSIADGSVEISSEFIAKSDEVGDDDVYNSILQWCRDCGFEPERFLFENTEPRPVAESLLNSIFDALNENDLQRVVMPLDVVKKLSR